MRKNLLSLIILAISFLVPKAVFAHAFGQKYTLPLPVWLYVFGGGAAIIASFLIIGYFIRPGEHDPLQKYVNLSKWRFFRNLDKPWLVNTAKLLGLALFAATVSAGMIGSQNPNLNFAPTFFWIVFLLGFTYTVAIFGDLWRVVNPLKTIAGWLAERPLVPYPKKWGYLPALLFYFFIIWLELLSGGSGVIPQRLALYMQFYAAISFLGAITFGIQDWFRYGDFFSVFFRTIGQAAPFSYEDGQFRLRWPFVGLFKEQAERFSLLMFIIFMLSSTAFDGFRETVDASKIISLLTFTSSSQIKQLVMLALVTLLFLLAYFAAIWVMELMVKTDKKPGELALMFAFSLIPIALVYNVAHYFTLFLVQGQKIIALASDPWNLGWNLFGTRDFEVNVGIIGAKATWNLQIAFILIGHIAAVYIAHLVALKIYRSARPAMISQIPMLVVMVIYTMTGLWILSQPLTIG